jgi:hypothetical protein
MLGDPDLMEPAEIRGAADFRLSETKEDPLHNELPENRTKVNWQNTWL